MDAQGSCGCGAENPAESTKRGESSTFVPVEQWDLKAVRPFQQGRGGDGLALVGLRKKGTYERPFPSL